LVAQFDGKGVWLQLTGIANGLHALNFTPVWFA
jgi:hypothetical protein